MPLPENLKNRRHDDWIWPLKYIPRKWTSFDWGVPVLWKGWHVEFVERQVMLQDKRWEWLFYYETWKCPKPINPAGGWQISYFPQAPWYWKWAAWYIARSFARGKDGKYGQFRLGARWDNVDEYVNWPTFPTGRRYTGDDFQWTNNWEGKPK